MLDTITNPSETPAKCGVCYTHAATVKLECKHSVCETCIQNWIKNCLKDVSRLPPQCCSKYITIQKLEGFLISHFKESDRIKFWKLLQSTHITCSNCGSYYINAPKDTEDGTYKIAVCHKCKHRECRVCHDEKDDKTDICECNQYSEKEAAIVTKERYYGRCPHCGVYVEKTTGCKQMTCVCHHRFCYYCARDWNKCACPKDAIDPPPGTLPGMYRQK